MSAFHAPHTLRLDAACQLHEGATTGIVGAHRKTISYSNDSSMDIVILDINNIPTIIRSNPDNSARYHEKIRLTTTYHFSNDGLKTTLLNIDQFDSNFPSIDQTHVKLKALLQLTLDKNPNLANYTVSVVRILPVDKLRQYEGVYEESMDVVVAMSSTWLRAPHPRSMEGRSMVDHSYYASSREVSGLLIEIVDNDNKIGPRFMYCGNRVIRIDPKIAHERQNGVYQSVFQNSVHTSNQTVPVYHEIGLAGEAIGLYRTEEEAQTHGNPEALVRQQELRAQAELLEVKRQAEADKADYQRRADEQQRELEGIRAQNAALKEQAEARSLMREQSRLQERDYYEGRSLVRKDSSESMKYVPTIITAIIGCIVGIIAWFK